MENSGRLRIKVDFSTQDHLQARKLLISTDDRKDLKDPLTAVRGIFIRICRSWWIVQIRSTKLAGRMNFALERQCMKRSTNCGDCAKNFAHGSVQMVQVVSTKRRPSQEVYACELTSIFPLK